MIHVEGHGVIDTEPLAARLAGEAVGDLEVEGRHPGRGDAHVKAGALAVVNLGAFSDTLLAMTIRQNDGLIAPTYSGLSNGDGDWVRYSLKHEVLTPHGVRTASPVLVSFVRCKGRERLRPGLVFDDARRHAHEQVRQ